MVSSSSGSRLVVLCWVLFFVLEGFDFGVGLLGPSLGRDDHERGAVVRTVGPFWDGNEVWLVAAIGVTFAAFPDWYAALLSGLYLPMVAILLLLAVRGVALEFRGKGDGDALAPPLRRGAGGQLRRHRAALGRGARACFVHGLALGADGEVTGAGSAAASAPLLSSAGAGSGRLLALFAALLLGATFLGPAHHRPGAAAGPPAGIARGHRRRGARWPRWASAPARGWCRGRRALRGRRDARPGSGREALAFGGTALAVARRGRRGLHRARRRGAAQHPGPGLVADHGRRGRHRLRAAADHRRRASSCCPASLVYQAFSYWVFRRRVASERVAS